LFSLHELRSLCLLANQKYSATFAHTFLLQAVLYFFVV